MDALHVLGAYGGKAGTLGTVALHVAPHTVIDAGNLLRPLGERVVEIENLFLTHSHLDHINDIPYLLDNTFHRRRKPLKIFATPKTLSNLSNHLFCKDVWADYTNIPFDRTGAAVVELVPVDYDRPVPVDGIVVTPVRNEHIEGSCAFVVEKEKGAILFSSDTYLCPSLTELLERDGKIHTAIFEVSFPVGMEELARKSGHLTPALLKKQLESLRRKDLRLYVNHLKPAYISKIRRQLRRDPFFDRFGVEILREGDRIDFADGRLRSAKVGEDIQEKFLRIIRLGRMFSEQADRTRLYDTVVREAREFVKADAGTLYMLDEETRSLRFEVIHNETLGVDGTEKPDWPPIPLYHEDGTPNLNMVAAAAAVQGKVINISDVYEDTSFDFSGTRKFDSMTGYRSRSMLVIPMKNHEERVIGVLQLINRKNAYGEIVPFGSEDIDIAYSLASQTAMLMSNQKLIHDLEEMLFSFLNSLADTLDSKSAFTGRHIERMVDLTMRIATAIRDDGEGAFKEVHFGEDEMKQIYLAALVHDIGKIVTPDYLVEKSTKLERVCDGIELIRLRLELARAQERADRYREALKALGGVPESLETRLAREDRETEETMRFLEEANRGSEFVDDGKLKKLARLAESLTFRMGGESCPVIGHDELKALSVRRGTLTEEERRIIMDHVKETQRNLARLNFPEKYRRIPEIAGAHHEKLNGTGYPDGLKAEEISLEARILAIADIFEALTASDRPYKRPNRLSEAMRILAKMAAEGELDYDIVRFFYEREIYLDYAKKHLHPDQIDEVDLKF